MKIIQLNTIKYNQISIPVIDMRSRCLSKVTLFHEILRLGFVIHNRVELTIITFFFKARITLC